MQGNLSAENRNGQPHADGGSTPIVGRKHRPWEPWWTPEFNLRPNNLASLADRATIGPARFDGEDGDDGPWDLPTTLLPRELLDARAWVCWAWETRPNDPKPTKVLKRLNGWNARSNAPSDWTTHDEVVNAYIADGSRFDGVGYVFSPDADITGIDLDDAVDAEGRLADWARPIVDGAIEASAYLEVSPGGRGIKVWVRGTTPDGRGRAKHRPDGTGCEVYRSGRYFTVTGASIGSPPKELGDGQAVIDMAIALTDAWKAADRERKDAEKAAERAKRDAEKPKVERATGRKPRAKAGGIKAEAAKLKRAKAYLDAIPGAVAGEGGHSQTFSAACAIGPGFDLDPDDAYKLLEEYNERCEPPWSTDELVHKVEQAYLVEERRGWLLKEGPGEEKDKKHKDILVDPKTGLKIMVDNPKRLADLFLEQRHSHRDRHTILRWNGEFHCWRDGAWHATPGEDVTGAVQAVIEAEFDRHAAATDSVVAPATNNLVNNVIGSIRSKVGVPMSRVDAQPAWLDGRPDDPGEFANFQNGVLHLPTVAEGRGEAALIPPTPLYFTPIALPFAYDPDAPEPRVFLDFLRDIWGHDPDSIRALRQWFGHLLSGDTDRQDILLIVGPTRSGKGTIQRLLVDLMGAGNVTTPRLADLGTRFGLQSFIGKRAAFFGESRLSNQADINAVVETILSISGDDRLNVQRKGVVDWEGYLRTKIIMLANEAPRLPDRAGAVMARLKVLSLTESFAGREDPELKHKLKAELPGIFNWAVEGWRDLNANGFVQPASGAEVKADMDEASNPMGKFIDEAIVVDPNGFVEEDDAFAHWRKWCESSEHRDHVGVKSTFKLGFKTALLARGVQVKADYRPRIEGRRPRGFGGITLGHFRSRNTTHTFWSKRSG